MPDTCKACGAPIVWAETAATGKAIPLDAEPAPDGNIYLSTSDGVAHYPPKGWQAPAGLRLYKSHFASCPQAAAFRRKK